MTTNDAQMRVLSDEVEARSYERLVDLSLQRLAAWTRLPDERTDWELEQLLDELRGAAIALRSLRSDAGLPF